MIAVFCSALLLQIYSFINLWMFSLQNGALIMVSMTAGFQTIHSPYLRVRDSNLQVKH